MRLTSTLHVLLFRERCFIFVAGFGKNIIHYYFVFINYFHGCYLE